MVRGDPRTQAGPSPDFPVPGAWLYLGDACVLHLIEADPAPTPYAEGESLRIEHMAFRATGMSDFVALLDANDVAYKLFPFDAMETVLVFIRDPDGNRIHVDFAAAEHAG